MEVLCVDKAFLQRRSFNISLACGFVIMKKIRMKFMLLAQS